MTKEQRAKYNELREECRDILLDVIDGEADQNKPKAITHPQASCLVSKVIYKLAEIDLLVDSGEEKK